MLELTAVVDRGDSRPRTVFAFDIADISFY